MLELPITICIFNNGYLGMVRQWQDLFYDKVYAGTDLKWHRGNGEVEYVPDFVKLAEAYGAQGIRVAKKKDIAKAFEAARAKTDGPTLIEFLIEDEELVLTMIKQGGPITDLITNI